MSERVDSHDLIKLPQLEAEKIAYTDVELGFCDRCGAETGDADIWQPLCPRCQQLAALEAEIGRAVIANYIVNNSIWSLDKDWSFTRATNDAMNILNKCLIVEGAIVGIIAQWRELHAEDAEAIVPPTPQAPPSTEE